MCQLSVFIQINPSGVPKCQEYQFENALLEKALCPSTNLKMNEPDTSKVSQDLELGSVAKNGLPNGFGRDEMNFAEFPMGLISNRAGGNAKTIYFKDEIYDKTSKQIIARKVTITGSDLFGLPTALDQDVLMVMIQLTALQNFTTRKIYFTRYQMIQLLLWPDNGGSYKRIKESLSRWMSVSFLYDKAWRSTKSWKDEGFHVIEGYSLERSSAADNPGEEAGTTTTSCSFTWSEQVFNSFTIGNVKALDFNKFIKLDSAIAKRLYRFLDKRFYRLSKLRFGLELLALEHVGLSRNSTIAEIKRQLYGSINELENVGFLNRLPKEEVFRKEGGIWFVYFEKKVQDELGGVDEPANPVQADLNLEEPPPLSPLAVKLMHFGVSEKKVVSLLSKFPEKHIADKIKAFQLHIEKRDRSVIKNPAGYIIKSIEENFTSTPIDGNKEDDLLAKKIKQTQVEETKNMRQQQIEERANLELDAINAYWRSLSQKESEEQEKIALNYHSSVWTPEYMELEMIHSMKMRRHAREALKAQGKWPE